MTSPIVPTGAEPPEAPVESPADDAGSTGAEERRRIRRRRRRIAVALVLLAATTAGALLIQLPYYLVQPGSVRPAEERVDIEGAQSFVDDGEILFTTVLLSRATPALMIRAFLDDAVEVRTVEETYPGGDVDAVRRENLQRMDLSKLVATRVALEHLGIDAEFRADGARVLGLTDSSPSEGLLHPGDVIVGVDGGEVSMPADIAHELSDREPGDEVPVEIRRPSRGEDASTSSVEVVLGSAPDGDDAERPVLGVEVEPADLTVDSDVSVHVDSGEVSGPSAGLAWTLSIIDRLTPGALTGGRRIAVTGEMNDDGTVGAVGGVVQKVSAVKRAGVKLFIYPAATPEAEQREMRRVAGDDLELRPVATLDDAVDLLAPNGLRLPG